MIKYNTIFYYLNEMPYRIKKKDTYHIIEIPNTPYYRIIMSDINDDTILYKVSLLYTEFINDINTFKIPLLIDILNETRLKFKEG